MALPSEFFEAASLYSDCRYKESFAAFERCYKQGLAGGALGVGRCYFMGLHGERNHILARKYFEESYKNNIITLLDRFLQNEENELVKRALAAYSLAFIYAQGRQFHLDVEKNEKRSVELYWFAATSGLSSAVVNLGVYYKRGSLLRLDTKLGNRLYAHACMQKNAQAYYNLGNAYRLGVGVANQFELAIELYEMACEGGYTNAYASLANMYREGRGVKKDIKKSKKMLLRGAQLGNAACMYVLGVFYERTKTFSAKDALHWYQESAQRGESVALRRLAGAHIQGVLGLTKNTEKGIELYMRAAELGSSAACTELARLYTFGIGVETDAVHGAMWSLKALEHGPLQYYPFSGVVSPTSTLHAYLYAQYHRFCPPEEQFAQRRVQREEEEKAKICCPYEEQLDSWCNTIEDFEHSLKTQK